MRIKLTLLPSHRKRRAELVLEQDEAMDVARSAPQGAHYHTDVIYLLP